MTKGSVARMYSIDREGLNQLQNCVVVDEELHGP